MRRALAGTKCMNAVDTNVRFYAHDSRDPNKQRIAAELIASLTDGALLWQVACEYFWASRKLEGFGDLYGETVEDIKNPRRAWSTGLPGRAAFDGVERRSAPYNLLSW